MSFQSNSSDPTSDELEAAEAKMRKTLGLHRDSSPRVAQQRPDQAKQKHRFVQDGETPVVMLNGRRDLEADASPRARIASLEAALEVERSGRARAEQAVERGLAAFHALETKLAHMELARTEELATERAARQQAETALQAALEAQTVPAPELTELAKIAVRRVSTRSTPRKSSQPTREPQPVKWWLPSFRAKISKD